MPRTIWSDTLMSNDIASGGTLHLQLTAGFSADETRLASMTLMRTIIGMDVGHAVHDSGQGSQLIDVGIGVTSQEAFAAGVASLPDPNTFDDFPTRGWVFRARGRVFGFAADQPAVYSWRIDRDVRSRRKLENGVAYIVFANSASEGSTGAVRVTGLIRQLYLLT